MDELRIWQLDQKINWTGAEIDIPLVKKIIKLYDEELPAYNRKMADLTEGEVQTVNQTGKILEYLVGEGIRLPNIQAETVQDYLGRDDLSQKARDILRLRQESSLSSLKKYPAMLRRTLEDDRTTRELLRYYGASTGRWSGLGIQFQNLSKGPYAKHILAIIAALEEDEIDYLRNIYGLFGALASCVRGMVVPKKGYDLCCVDYSSIEARIVSWLADDQDALEMFRGGRDIYRDMAASIYGVTYDEIQKESKERGLGKVAILGLGFGMGPKRFLSTCHSWGMGWVDMDLATQVVRTYRAKYHRVKNLWGELNDRAKNAILYSDNEDYLACKLPSERLLYYHKPKVEWKPKFKDRKLVECITHMTVDSQKRKWGRVDTWGGTLLENVAQAIARDLMAYAMLRLDRRGIQILFTVHDEIICQVPEGKNMVEEISEIMCDSPDWAEGLPVAAEGWQGKRYRKG